jgi:hypothetical protein
MKDTVLLVHSGDKGQPWWKYFFHYYRKYWNCQGICDTMFLGETKSVAMPGILTEKTGPAPWGEGLIKCLERIPHRFVILVHEDYALDEAPFPALLASLIDLMRQKDMKLLKCCGWWAGDPDWHKDNAFGTTDMTVNGISGNDEPIYRYNNDHMYLISHQAAIWDRMFLRSTIEPQWSPWEHELTGTDKLRSQNVPIYCYRGKMPISYGELVTHGAVREGMQKFIDEADREGVQEVQVV